MAQNTGKKVETGAGKCNFPHMRVIRGEILKKTRAGPGVPWGPKHPFLAPLKKEEGKKVWRKKDQKDKCF